MKNRLILFSIGSIQDFIINSRKTVDLYNSSLILSNLIKQGISFFQGQKYNAQLILPCINMNSNNVPNYFIIEYKSNKSMGLYVERDLRKHYHDYFKSILREKESEINIITDELEKQIKRQLEDSLDIYWVDYELENNDKITNDNYMEIYKKLYEYLNGVKNYKQIKLNSEEGKKCTICGKRNALFVGKNSSKKPQFTYISENVLKENEMLCSECYLKRIYQYQKCSNTKKIPSTAEIAVSLWLRKVQGSKDFYDKYEEVFDKFYSEVQAANESKNIDKAAFRYPEAWENINSNGRNLFKEDLTKLKIAFKKLNNNNINKYYCIYRMDIDNLGKWTNGKYKNNRNTSLFKYQQTLSSNISAFFTNICYEMNKLDNTLLVYAGGDDMLALLPVDKIYNFIKTVKQKFYDSAAKDDYKKITYSEGIFITHYKAPLGEVIRVSKGELENLKNRFKEKRNDYDIPKNATIISIMNEGYDLISLYYKRNTEYSKEKLKIDANDFIFEYMSDKFYKEFTFFHNEFEIEFMDFDKNLNDMLECDNLVKMIEIEQKRWLGKSVINNKNLKTDLNEKIKLSINELNSNLINFLKINCKNSDTVDMKNYFNVFHIVRKLNSIIKEGESIENITNKA